jgi:hypothetical protein
MGEQFTIRPSTPEPSKAEYSREGAKHVLSEVEGGAKEKNNLYVAFLASWRMSTLWPAVGRGFRFPRGYGIKRSMERIEPQQDHKWLDPYVRGQQVRFQGKVYTIQGRTTLASGEAAVVLESEKEQFVISAAKFLAGLS